MINIDESYVRIMCICHNFIDCSISDSNIQHSMLDFHKENTVSRKHKIRRIFPTFMLASLVNIYSFGARYIYG